MATRFKSKYLTDYSITAEDCGDETVLVVIEHGEGGLDDVGIRLSRFDWDCLVTEVG